MVFFITQLTIIKKLRDNNKGRGKLNIILLIED